jgi:hypothetical protein
VSNKERCQLPSVAIPAMACGVLLCCCAAAGGCGQGVPSARMALSVWKLLVVLYCWQLVWWCCWQLGAEKASGSNPGEVDCERLSSGSSEGVRRQQYMAGDMSLCGASYNWNDTMVMGSALQRAQRGSCMDTWCRSGSERQRHDAGKMTGSQQ